VEILSDYAVTGEYANIFIQAPDGIAVEILSPATE
jgi:hypothetical protein